MERILPPEIVFKVLKNLSPVDVSRYMQGNKSTLESGQEIKKSKSAILMKNMSEKSISSALKKVKPEDPLYWSKAYRQLRRASLIEQVKTLLANMNQTNEEKTKKLLEIGNLLIENRDIFSTMGPLKKTIRTLLREFYHSSIPLESKAIIEIIYLELFPEKFDQDFGFGLSEIFV
jgi:hypothetical protein